MLAFGGQAEAAKVATAIFTAYTASVPPELLSSLRHAHGHENNDVFVPEILHRSCAGLLVLNRSLCSPVSTGFR